MASRGRLHVSRPRLVRAFAVPAVTGSLAATLPLVTGTAVTLTYSGVEEPTPSGTVFFDTRAGGNYDLQAMTSVSDFDAIPGMGAFSGSPEFTTDYDGAGKHALRFPWAASTGESSFAWLYYLPTTYSNLYVSVVIHLGRTATGGGIGTLGSFSAGHDPLGAAMKRFFFYRLRDNAAGSILWTWPTGSPGPLRNELTGTSRTQYWNADYGEGTDVRWTWELIPGTTSIVRQWRNGVLVLENTNAGIGTGGFAQVIFPSNRQHTGQDETEYWTDLVMWTV